MESRKHDYKNRTLAAARLRKELEMLSDKVKKLMNFGPHFHICDVSEITEDHIHLESCLPKKISQRMMEPLYGKREQRSMKRQQAKTDQ